MGYLCVQIALILAGALAADNVGAVLKYVVALIGPVVLTVVLIQQRVPLSSGWYWVAASAWVFLGAAVYRYISYGSGATVQLAAATTPVLIGVTRVLLAIGLLQLSRRGTPRKAADAIDAWIAAAVGFLLLWVDGLDSVWGRQSGLLGPMALLVGSLVLVAAAVQLAFASRMRDLHIVFVLLGTVGLITSGVVLVAPTLVTGNPIITASIVDYLWPWFPAMVGAAALVPGLADSPSTTHRGRDLAPGGIALYVLLVLLVPSVLAIEYNRGSGGRQGYLVFVVPAAASAVLLLLLVARLALVARTSHSRAQELDRRTTELAAALSKQDELHQRLRHQATHDPLTGLANRTVLLDRLGQLADPDHRRHTLLLLDLDAFKTVNDTMGHRTGDALLIEVAHRLARISPPDAVTARLGGDEFAILLVDTTIEAARDLAAKLQTEISRTMLLGGHRVAVTTSIGVSTVTPQRGLTLFDAIHEADEALYVAKTAGRNRIAVV